VASGMGRRIGGSRHSKGRPRQRRACCGHVDRCRYQCKHATATYSSQPSVCSPPSTSRPQLHNHPLHLAHLPRPRLPLQPLQALHILRLQQLLPSLDHHPTLDIHLAPLLRRQPRTLGYKLPRQLLVARAHDLTEERLPPDRALPLLRHRLQLAPVPLGHKAAQPQPPPRLLGHAELGLDLGGALAVAEGDEAEQRGVEGQAREPGDAAALGVGGDVAVQRVLDADQSLGFLAGGFVDAGAGVFAVGEDLGGELQLVGFGLRGGLGEGFGEEQVGAVEGAVVLVVEGFEQVFVLGGGGGFDKCGGDGAAGEYAEEGGEGEFLFEMQEDEEDEVRVSAFERFVERDLVFFHGEEEGDLLAGAGLVVEEFGGEMSSAFVVGGARDGFEGDAAFVGELGDDGFADCGFIGGGVADFLACPVDIDLVGGDMEVLGEANDQLVFATVDETFDQTFRGKALILVE